MSGSSINFLDDSADKTSFSSSFSTPFVTVVSVVFAGVSSLLMTGPLAELWLSNALSPWLSRLLMSSVWALVLAYGIRQAYVSYYCPRSVPPEISGTHPTTPPTPSNTASRYPKVSKWPAVCLGLLGAWAMYRWELMHPEIFSLGAEPYFTCLLGVTVALVSHMAFKAMSEDEGMVSLPDIPHRWLRGRTQVFVVGFVVMWAAAYCLPIDNGLVMGGAVALAFLAVSCLQFYFAKNALQQHLGIPKSKTGTEPDPLDESSYPFSTFACLGAVISGGMVGVLVNQSLPHVLFQVLPSSWYSELVPALSYISAIGALVVGAVVFFIHYGVTARFLTPTQEASEGSTSDLTVKKFSLGTWCLALAGGVCCAVSLMPHCAEVAFWMGFRSSLPNQMVTGVLMLNLVWMLVSLFLTMHQNAESFLRPTADTSPSTFSKKVLGILRNTLWETSRSVSALGYGLVMVLLMTHGFSVNIFGVWDTVTLCGALMALGAFVVVAKNADSLAISELPSIVEIRPQKSLLPSVDAAHLRDSSGQIKSSSSQLVN